MTCSAGVAEAESDLQQVKIGEAVDRLYNDLCDHLYQAKASGGDYVVGSPKSTRMR